MAKKREPQTRSLFKKEIRKMPDGYYSGDQPNPNLRAFVEQHLKERPYDPETDDYDIPAFDKPIETTKATAIYNMHTYWSKKPHDAIRQYIRHYTKPGDLVLDPFCGSGGTALAALMEGRKAIAIDRSPAATFITKNYCTPVDVDELQDAFEKLKRKVKPEIDWLYETRCDRCGGKATTAYTVYSQVFQCPRCLEKFPLFDCVEAEGRTAKGKPKKIRACPRCHEKGIVEKISTRGERFGAVPVLVSYLCDSGCTPARDERRHNDPDPKKREHFEQFDLGKIREIESKEIPHWYPTDTFPQGMITRQPIKAGADSVDKMFTKRNLWALSAVFSATRQSNMRDELRFAVTSVSLALSSMQRYSPDSGFPNMVLAGTYYIPPIGREIEVLSWLGGKLRSLSKGFAQLDDIDRTVMISTSDARNLALPANSVDYIFTDPPYADKVQYGEANYLWECWMRFDKWLEEEIIVNKVRGKGEDEWGAGMRLSMEECFRVLKPGRAMSLCYHDSSGGTWQVIQDILAETGFIAEQSRSALYIDTRQKSFKQTTTDNVTKRDLVINLRKPKPGEVAASVAITGEEDEKTFDDKVRQIIHDYLDMYPGATKDRIYDELVSRMVRSGRMEAHDFDQLLRQVAEEVKTPVMKNLFDKKEPDLFGTHEMSRWYLKETQLAVADAAETAKEDKAVDSLSAFMARYLKDNPGGEGVHYSDLFEHYIYAVKDKPRRQLAEFLPDYFYKTEHGTWRLPASEEEERAKAEARAKGLGRRVKRYLAQLEHGAAIPEGERPNDATLAEWIRHCKRAGLYEKGKLLYEKGGLNPSNLTDEAMANVEEDYQVCARLLGRGQQGQAGKRRRQHKE